tara:strand:- start:2392 stop:3120 length:729 start_codon:yes stop_codon:yes gene_type:complete
LLVFLKVSTNRSSFPFFTFFKIEDKGLISKVDQNQLPDFFLTKKEKNSRRPQELLMKNLILYFGFTLLVVSAFSSQTKANPKKYPYTPICLTHPYRASYGFGIVLTMEKRDSSFSKVNLGCMIEGISAAQEERYKNPNQCNREYKIGKKAFFQNKALIENPHICFQLGVEAAIGHLRMALRHPSSLDIPLQIPTKCRRAYQSGCTHGEKEELKQPPEERDPIYQCYLSGYADGEKKLCSSSN